MTEKNIRDALFNEIHKAIAKSAESVGQFDASGISYPPSVELTPDEAQALSAIQLSDSAKSGLKKLVADACAYPLFHFFSLLDAASDPDIDFDDVWLGATIEAKTDEADEPMLHDELYETCEG